MLYSSAKNIPSLHIGEVHVEAKAHVDDTLILASAKKKKGDAKPASSSEDEEEKPQDDDVVFFLYGLSPNTFSFF